MFALVFLTAALFFRPSTAYTVVPGLTDASNPQCTSVTFYYHNPAELSAATSSYLSSNSICTTPASDYTTTTTSSSTVASTSTSCNIVPQIPNPGFEDVTMSPWFQVAGTGSAAVFSNGDLILSGVQPNDARGGNGYLAISIPPAAQAGQVVLAQQNLDVCAGATYTLTAWFNFPGQGSQPISSNDCQYGVAVDNAEKVVDYNAGMAANEWFNVTLTYTSNTDKFGIILIGAACKVTSFPNRVVLVDDFTIERI